MAVRLTERDRSMCRFAHKHRGVTIAHLHKQFFRTAKARTACYVRTAKLVTYDWLTVVGRLPVPNGVGSGQRVFLPGKAVLPLLRRELGLSSCEMARARSPQFLAHHVALVDLYLAVSLACEQSMAFRLLSWKGDHEWHQAPLCLPAAAKAPAATLIPDSSFVLQTPDGQQHPFFIELDLGHMTAKRMRARLALYLTLPSRTQQLVPLLLVTTTSERQRQLATWTRDEALSLGVDSTVIWLTRQEQLTEATFLTQPIFVLGGQSQPVALTQIHPFAAFAARENRP